MSSENEAALASHKIVRDIVSQLRISSDLPSIFDLAIEALTKLCRADRGVIWQLVDDQFVATSEFAQNGLRCFKGANLGAQETTAIVSEFLAHGTTSDFKEKVIAIADASNDDAWSHMAPTLVPLIQQGDGLPAARS
jgi:GAF domain-containing protein